MRLDSGDRRGSGGCSEGLFHTDGYGQIVDRGSFGFLVEGGVVDKCIEHEPSERRCQNIYPGVGGGVQVHPQCARREDAVEAHATVLALQA